MQRILSHIFGLFAFAGLLCACEGLNLPLDLETDAATLDVDAALVKAEAKLCEDTESDGCKILKALDATDGTESDPPALPDSIPTSVDVEGLSTGEPTVSVDEWLKKEDGVLESIRAKHAVSADLTDKVGATNKEKIKEVVLNKLAFNWQENTLSFDMVTLDFYLSLDSFEDITDPDALLAEESMTKIGTITGQLAGEAGEVDVEFDEGGEDKFMQALEDLTFTLVVGIPDEATLELKLDEAENMIKPSGIATVSLQAEVVYTIETGSSGSGGGADAETDADADGSGES